MRPKPLILGSAAKDSTRLLDGTLGVAVIGSVYASLYGSRLTAGLLARLPSGLSAGAHQSVGAAIAVWSRLSAGGLNHIGIALHRAPFAAFLHGTRPGSLVAGGVAAVGAFIAAAFLPAQPPLVGARQESDVLEREPEVTGSPVPSLEPAGLARARPWTATPGPVTAVGPTAGTHTDA